MRPLALARSSFERLEHRTQLAADVPDGFADQPFGPTISAGTAMEFAPDGRLFVLTQDGTVRIVSRSGSSFKLALSIQVNDHSERGLLGLAFDPAFATNGYVYLYYTERPDGEPLDYTGQTRNRVSRFTVNGDVIDPASEKLIVRLDPVNAGNHNGGALHFGSDGKLYVAVGENAVASNAQSLANRHGKILRLNADGSIPDDNPTSFPGIAGTTSGVNRAIWAVGLRNPFTFNFDPANGRMHINDVGQNSFEEVNVGGKGRNYGWPATEGGFSQGSFPDYTPPLYYYAQGDTSTTGAAITGGAFYRSSAAARFPSSFQGKYLFSDFISDWINVIDPNAPPASPSSAQVFATGTPGIVDLDVGPDGALYYLNRAGTETGVRRVVANSGEGASINGKRVLSVRGSAASDAITVSLKNSRIRVSVNGIVQTFAPSKVRRISVYAHDGDDAVAIGRGVIGVGIHGGDGRDTISGGDGRDSLVGGTGSDKLIGHGGIDTLLGGGGNDTLLGGGSIDVVDGGAGTDRSDKDSREKRVRIELLL